MSTMLDRIRRVQQRELPPPPIATLIGFDVITVEPGQAYTRSTPRSVTAIPWARSTGRPLRYRGRRHGPAWVATLSEGETFTTLELKVNFLKPVQTGQLTAIGRVVKGGHRIGLVECDIIDATQRLVARASSTVMTLRGEDASGR